MPAIIRETTVPLYIQIAEDIKSKIEEGKIQPNTRIPTELELSSDYGVSRITIRKALELLVEEGILIRRKKVGTFVSYKKISRSLNTYMGFSQCCELEGNQPGTRFLSAELVKARPSDIRTLRLEEEEKVIRIRRLRYCNDVPVIVEETRFPKKYAYLLAEDLTRSLHEILHEHGITVRNGSLVIGVCYATREEAEYLQVNERDALILARDAAYDMSGEPVCCGRQVINAERYEFKVLTNNMMQEEHGSGPDAFPVPADFPG